jgi:hypothetical protein
MVALHRAYLCRLVWWDEASFLAALTGRGSQEAATVARHLLAWCAGRRIRLWWGKGRQDGSFYPMFDHAGQTHWLFAAWTSGTVAIQFAEMR